MDRSVTPPPDGQKRKRRDSSSNSGSDKPQEKKGKEGTFASREFNLYVKRCSNPDEAQQDRQDAPRNLQVTSEDIKANAQLLIKALATSENSASEAAYTIIGMIDSPNGIISKRGVDKWQGLSPQDNIRQLIERTYEITTQQSPALQTLELVAGSPRDQQVASTSEVPIQYRAEQGTSATNYQPTSIPEVLIDQQPSRVLDKSSSQDKLTQDYIDGIKNIISHSTPETSRGLTHFLLYIQKLRDYKTQELYTRRGLYIF